MKIYDLIEKFLRTAGKMIRMGFKICNQLNSNINE